MEIYFKGFNLIKKKFSLSFILLSFLTVIGAIFEALGIALILPFLDFLLNPNNISTNQYLNLSFFFETELSYHFIITFYSIFFFLVYLLKNLILIIINYTQSKILLNINFYLSNLFFKNLLKQNFLSLIEEKSSSVIRTMLSQTANFADKFINSLAILFVELITLIIILIFVFLVSQKVVIILGITIIFILLVYFLYFKKKIYNLSKNIELNEIDRIKNLTNGFNYVDEINIYNIKDFLIKKDLKINFRIIKSALILSVIRIIPRSLVETLIVFFITAFVILILQDGKNITEFIPTLGLIALSVLRLLPSANRLMLSMQKLVVSKPIIENILNKLNSYKDSETINNYSNFPIKFEKIIKLNDISFTFPGTKKIIFNNLNLTIKKNQKIGIFGNSGSGKSTLIKILMGIIPPNKGTITVDGYKINKNIENWQKIISYIPQKIFLFENSLQENIELFQNNKTKFDQIINKVFRNKDEFLNLSKNLRNNHLKLSGGQIKKIGIARALYKDHDILIIDEGTAGLELDYIDYFISQILKTDKTVIFITHDLKQLENFEIVYNLKENKLLL